MGCDETTFSIELQVAKRFGVDGFDVLAALPVETVAALCAKLRAGKLDDGVITYIRTRYDRGDFTTRILSEQG